MGQQTPEGTGRSAGRWIVVLVVCVALVGAAVLLWRKQGPPVVQQDADETLAPGAAAGFNVVVVTLDTTRADRLGCYGYANAATPVLDRLAGEGIRFADAVSCVPLTLPAHTSIFTGLIPPNHDVRNNGEYRLDPSRTTLAEVLMGEGYETAAFVSAFVLDRRFGLDQGFSHYDDRVETTTGPRFGTAESQRSASAMTDAVIAWLASRNKDKPLFLWAHYYDPHDPYEPPPEYAQRFSADPYDGEIAFMDAQLGRLLSTLEAEGLAERTLLIIVGDHGESLGEHHEGTHGRLVYEATQHVPLILWCPPLVTQSQVVDDAAVSIVDVFPTVLDLLGVDFVGPLDGISLRLARQQPDRSVYAETMMTYLENGWAPLYALRRHTDKYILAPQPEYYDLAADPHELTNLLTVQAARPPAAGRLANALDDLLKSGPSAAQVAADAVKVDDEALQKLRSLGYLGGAGPTEAKELPDPKLMMPVREVFLAAKLAARSRRFDIAYTRLHEVLEQWPNDPSVLRELGMICLQTNRLDEAKQVFSRHIELKPAADILMFLGQIALRERRLDDAKDYIDQALALEPDHGAVLVTRGDIAAMSGNADEAMQWYLRAKEIDPYRATGLADQRIQRLNRQGG